jgi:glycerol-3-phosphate acyltransferase PlsY
MPAVLLVLTSYLLGGIPFALLFVLVTKRVDLRKHGSGNVGATNASRMYSGGAQIAVFVLLFLLDSGKGFVAAMFLADYFALPGEPWPAVAGLAAVIGHVFTPYLRTLGGKGVATTVGALVALAPGAMGIGLLSFAIVFAIKRIVALGSIALALAMPIAAAALGSDNSVIALTVILGAVIVMRHSSNIKRLLNGSED